MNAALPTTKEPEPAGPAGLAGEGPCVVDLVGEDEPGPDDAGDGPVPGCGPGPRVAASDAQLAAWIGAVVERDERALAALYDATFHRVFGLVHRIVREAATAEEVAEDAYFQVWRQAVRFDPARGKALTWLLAMARSRALDALRRGARFRHASIDGERADEEGVSDALPADELLDLARSRADLNRALQRLGPQPRQLVSLAFLRGLSHEEIAEQTRLPLGTVKSQIRRALLSLRQILGVDGAPRLAS